MAAWRAAALLGRDVAGEGGAVPADEGGADGGGDVVVAGGDIDDQRAEGVERRLVAPLLLLADVHLNLVHGDGARALDHDLAAPGPGALRQLAQGAQLG